MDAKTRAQALIEKIAKSRFTWKDAAKRRAEMEDFLVAVAQEATALGLALVNIPDGLDFTETRFKNWTERKELPAATKIPDITAWIRKRLAAQFSIAA